MKSRMFVSIILLLMMQFSAMAVDVEGTVVDKSGKGLPYVSLYLKHYPEVGTITDINGRFKLDVPSTRDSLIVSLVGYETMFIDLSKFTLGRPLRITMKDQPHWLLPHRSKTLWAWVWQPLSCC